jgi:hypothetical protein
MIIPIKEGEVLVVKDKDTVMEVKVAKVGKVVKVE